MNPGLVDDELRALITMAVGPTRDGKRHEIPFWIDTAFNGGLMMPRHVITTLGLTQASCMEATLADGSTVELETYACFFDWFGDCFETQIIANDGKHALLGTMLLANHRLYIDYATKVVDVS
jgi:clan AA aspartic protease